MAECAFCRADTDISHDGMPVCVNCADKPRVPKNQLLDILQMDLRDSHSTGKSGK